MFIDIASRRSTASNFPSLKQSQAKRPPFDESFMETVVTNVTGKKQMLFDEDNIWIMDLTGKPLSTVLVRNRFRTW